MLRISWTVQNILQDLQAVESHHTGPWSRAFMYYLNVLAKDSDLMRSLACAGHQAALLTGFSYVMAAIIIHVRQGTRRALPAWSPLNPPFH